MAPLALLAVITETEESCLSPDVFDCCFPMGLSPSLATDAGVEQSRRQFSDRGQTQGSQGLMESSRTKCLCQRGLGGNATAVTVGMGERPVTSRLPRKLKAGPQSVQLHETGKAKLFSRWRTLREMSPGPSCVLIQTCLRPHPVSRIKGSSVKLVGLTGTSAEDRVASYSPGSMSKV